MKKLFWIYALIMLAVSLCSASFAATSYVVTNNDNFPDNSATIYSLNTTTGELTHLMDLSTGGSGSTGGYYATVGTSAAVTGTTTGCLFVYDAGTSDIASFRVDLKTLGITLVATFSNGTVLGGYPNGSIAVTPSGKFLYATYPSTWNIGAWEVSSDCSLSFLAAVADVRPYSYEGIKVTPNGKYLVATVPGLNEARMFSIDSTTGALHGLGVLSFNSLSECVPNACSPAGMDITADSSEVIFGNSSVAEPSVFTAAITSAGLKDPTYFSLANTGDLSNDPDVPFLSAAAYHGSGAIYFGVAGTSKTGSQPGVLTGSFSEADKSITGKTATAITSPSQQIGLIASTGDWMVVSELYNTLQVFKINADGTLTPTAQGPVSNHLANGAYSFFIYPNSR
jgi:hypothetical protein